MKRTMTVLLLLAANGSMAQTRVDLGRQGGNVDFSAAPATRPAKTGTVLPATCEAGEIFFKLNAAPGRNLYGCSAANQWTQLSGAVESGCGLVGCEGGECAIDSGIVPTYTGTLEPGHVVVGGGMSALKTIAPGAAGKILTAAGPGADPVWSDPLEVATHSALSHLDYASSGHTGFQPALGYVPEQELTFTAPLQRTGNTISCPGCGEGGAGTAPFGMEFASSLELTVAGSSHGIGPLVLVQVYDASAPRNRVEPDVVRVDPASGDVTVTFAVPQSGLLVLR